MAARAYLAEQAVKPFDGDDGNGIAARKIL